MDISSGKRGGEQMEDVRIRKSPRFSVRHIPLREKRPAYPPLQDSLPQLPSHQIPLSAAPAPPQNSTILARQSVPNPPPGTLTTPNEDGSLFCSSCRRKFPDFTALEYHKNMKMRSIQKTKINTESFNTDTMIALCPFPTCCFHSQKVEDVHVHMQSRHKRQRTKDFIQRSGGEQKMLSVFIIPKHAEGETGVITCPSCSTVLNSEASLKRHLEKSCRGYGVFNCVMCGQHSRNRGAMVNHMKLAHPPPPGRGIRLNSVHILTLLTSTYIGLRLTGMFTGGRKKTRGGAGELEARSFPLSLLILPML